MPKTQPLPQIEIKESKDRVIKLTEVPSKGATALINVDELNNPDSIPYRVQVFLADKEVGKAAGNTPVEKLPLEILVPKEHLLDHVGPKGAEFKYSFNFGGNVVWSDPVNYEIRH